MLSALKILFLKTIFKKEGIDFLGKDVDYEGNEVLVFHDSKEDIRFGVGENEIKFPKDTFFVDYSNSEMVEKIIKNIKAKQKLQNLLSKKIEPYLNFSDKDMKKYLVEYIDDLEV